MSAAAPLLKVEGLTKHFHTSRNLFGKPTHTVRAVEGVSFEIGHGETLGLVGESGSGKSTTGRLILRLEEPTAGTVTFDGQEISGLSPSQLAPVRRRLQVVFQDPFSSLNPRLRVGDSVGEPLSTHGVTRSAEEKRGRVAALFRQVGLDPKFMDRFPHQFSGGQRQRIGIARAIALGPKLIVADEPITALDVSIQAQIVNLFLDLRDSLGLAYLFISHDLRVVRAMAHRIMVMKGGQVVESGDAEAVLRAPREAYTQALMRAAFDL